MFNELDKYGQKGHFFCKPTDSLEEVCNVPADKSGVYIAYALKNGRIELVYIGSSGKKLLDGNMENQGAGSGSLKDALVNGHHFGKTPRKRSWPIQMLSEGIEALDVYWWVTYDDKNDDSPLEIESIILHKYYEIYGELPKWNKKSRRSRKE